MKVGGGGVGVAAGVPPTGSGVISAGCSAVPKGVGEGGGGTVGRASIAAGVGGTVLDEAVTVAIVVAVGCGCVASIAAAGRQPARARINSPAATSRPRPGHHDHLANQRPPRSPAAATAAAAS